MKRLRANVQRATGGTVHRRAGALLPVPAYVEIQAATHGAFYLFYFEADGTCMTDTWHESIEHAKAQANFEFEITDDEWVEVP